MGSESSARVEEGSKKTPEEVAEEADTHLLFTEEADTHLLFKREEVDTHLLFNIIQSSNILLKP